MQLKLPLDYSTLTWHDSDEYSYGSQKQYDAGIGQAKPFELDEMGQRLGIEQLHMVSSLQPPIRDITETRLRQESLLT